MVLDFSYFFGGRHPACFGGVPLLHFLFLGLGGQWPAPHCESPCPGSGTPSRRKSESLFPSQGIDDQIKTSLPKRKNLWKQIVKQKILNQASVLKISGKPHLPVLRFAEKVKSGDTTHGEAKAASKYWKIFATDSFPDFTGDSKSEIVPNVALSYGYSVLCLQEEVKCKAGGRVGKQAEMFWEEAGDGSEHRATPVRAERPRGETSGSPTKAMPVRAERPGEKAARL